MILDNRDDIRDVVSDQDTPSWWYLDKEKKELRHIPKDKRNKWMWEVYGNEDNDISAWDSFLPVP